MRLTPTLHIDADALGLNFEQALKLADLAAPLLLAARWWSISTRDGRCSVTAP